MNNFKTIAQAQILAKRKSSKGTFNWLMAGAENNQTELKNIEDLDAIKIQPRILNRTDKLNLRSRFIDTTLTSPLILSPMGHQTQFHKFGEIETSFGTKKYGTLTFFSTQGRIDLEEIKKKTNNKKLVWEIFPFGNKSWIEKQIKIAEKSKCLAVSFCFDANVRSQRYIDIETGYDARKHGVRKMKAPPNPSISRTYDWDFIKWVKRKTKLKIIPKGLLDIEDIKHMDKILGDYIWISNHGGRMFNSGISPVDVLKKIKQKKIKLRSKIIVDGGVRKGTDVLKYICLGADLIGIGRPAIFGLILDGRNGVEKIFKIIEHEIFTAMINGGFGSLKELNFKRLIFDEKK